MAGLPAMPATLDLTKAFKHQRHGDIVIVLTWVNDSRALVLLPALRRDAGWYIVDESAAWLWGVDHPDREARRAALAHTLEQSVVACDVLGIEPSMRNRARIVSLVSGWIPDLVRMPTAPLPEMSSTSRGEIVLTVDGRVVREEEIKVEADQGAVYG
jgi:hypothetical protein